MAIVGTQPAREEMSENTCDHQILHKGLISSLLFAEFQFLKKFENTSVQDCPLGDVVNVVKVHFCLP